jgi:FkbH-like protein
MVTKIDQTREACVSKTSKHDLVLNEMRPDVSLATLNKIYSSWSSLEDTERQSDCAHSLRLAILSNYSTQFLAKGLQLFLAQRSINVSLFEGGYNQWDIELLEPDGELRSFRPDMILLSLTTCLLSLRNASGDAAQTAERVADLVIQAKAGLDSTIVITLPEPLEEELYGSFWSSRWRQEFSTSLQNHLDDIAIFVDLEPLIRRCSGSNWFAGRYYVTQKLNCHPNAIALFADYLAQHIASVVARPIRLVAIDLDNTLWGGIVGEDGWDGIDLNAEGSGIAYLKLQRFLLDLHAKGVLLVALSKNNREDVVEVFEKRPEMILKPHHFSDMRINWDSKSENFRQSLAELNLSPVGTAFIDDNPVERSEMKALMPDVHVPGFPEDPIDLVNGLISDGRFLIARSTKEDTDRQAFYRTESQRRDSKTQVSSLEDFYRSLNLQLQPVHIGTDNMERSLELIGKTNQFNVTAKKCSVSDIGNVLATKGAVATAYTLKDKFGDYGIIGVLLCLPNDAESLTIDTWVLSCRAMGRTVEYGMFTDLARCARRLGYRNIIGQYKPSAKNHPVKDLFKKLGFHQSETGGADDGQTFAFPLDEKEPEIPFINLVDSADTIGKV